MNSMHWRTWLALGAASSVAALLLYNGALHGRFISDDINHIPDNPHIQTLDGAHLAALLDPRGLPAALSAIGVRAFVTLRGRREEAVYWVWAGASYAPVSQVFPFIYPMADRYLYFILPGLLGAGFWMVHDASQGLAARLRTPTRSVLVAAAALAPAVGLAFAAHTWRQAFVWRSEAHVVRQAVRSYPEGIGGLYLRAIEAGGPDADVIRSEWEMLRRQRR